jgi:hypothetical protein
VVELERELASHEDRYGHELTRHHLDKALRLADEEKSGDDGLMEYTSKKCIRSCNCIGPKNCYDRTCPLVIELDKPAHPTPKEAPEGLIRLCEELLDIVENPYYSEGNESDTETIHKSDSFDFDKAKKTLSHYRPAPSRTEKPEIVCPACDFEGEAVKVCPSCGTPEKGKASFAGIAPDRTGELVKRLRDLRDGHLWSDAIEDDWRAAEREMAKKIDEILRDFEGGA